MKVHFDVKQIVEEGLSPYSRLSTITVTGSRASAA